MIKRASLCVWILLYIPVSLGGEENSHYSNQLRQDSLERASLYATQMHERVDSINQLSGYFAPKGVSVFDSERLKVAIQRDSIQRQTTLSQMNQAVQNKIQSLQEREIQTFQTILDERGELKTYDLPTIRNASGQLERVLQESIQLQIHLQTDYKENLRRNVVLPYANRSKIWNGHSSVEKYVSNYVNGSGVEWGGLKGFEKSVRSAHEQFNETALSIQRAEEERKNNLAQNYILGGVTLASSLIALIPSGGTSANGWIVGLGILNSTIGIGNNARNQIILENKGVEGFRSINEQISSIGVQITQTALGAATTVIQIRESLKYMNQSGPLTTRQWFQTLSTINQISEFNGIKQKTIGENASHALNATFAFSNLLFSYVDPKNSLQEPSQLTKKSNILKQNLDRVENIYTIAQGIPEIRTSLEQNPYSQFFIPTLNLTRNLGTKLLDRALYNQLKDRSFKFNDIKPFFDLSVLNETQIKKYISDPKNGFALDAIYETLKYGKQTQKDPYALQNRVGETIETKYFTRRINEDEKKYLKMSEGEMALFASLYKQNPTLNSYNLTAPSLSSKEDRTDFYFILPDRDLDKVLKGDKEVFKTIAPEKILNIHGNDTGIRMGPYQSYQTPLGLVYGGKVQIGAGFEKFILPEIGALRSLPSQNSRALGGGFIRIGNEPPLKYSGLYTYQWQQGLNEIYSIAIGQENGGLLIGVGTTQENLKEARLGFILPTGSGILLEPTHRPEQTHLIAYQALNQKWSSLFEKPNDYMPSNESFKTKNYLTSIQFEKNLKINSLKYFFLTVPELISTIDRSFGKTESFSSKGEVSLSSLAKFYEKTDPTKGGIYQLSYFYSTPHSQSFEFATRNGFKYEQVKDTNRLNSEDISSQWNVPFHLNHWIPTSALYQQSSSNRIYLSSWEKGLTLKTYQSKEPLSLETVFFNRWKTNSKLLTQETEIWTRYENGINLAKVAMEILGHRMSRNPLREKKSFISSDQITKIKEGSHFVRPLLKMSYSELKKFEPAFDRIQKTRLLDPATIDQYKKDSESIRNGFKALTELVPQLKSWNIVSQDARLNRAVFEPIEYQIKQRDLFWKGLDSNLIKLTNTEKALRLESNSNFEKFRSQLSQSSLLIHFTPSAIEYSRAKLTLNESPFLIPSSIQFAFHALVLEGNEEENLWKQSFGLLGGKLIDKIPLSSLGGRMITVYEAGPPSRGKLINLWLWQTMEDSFKYNKLRKFKLPRLE